MFENLIPSTMPVNTFLKNHKGIFMKKEFEEGRTGWALVECVKCSGPCGDVYYDQPASIYTPQYLSAPTADEYFESEEITEIVAMPPIWLAEQVGKALVTDILPAALGQYLSEKEPEGTFDTYLEYRAAKDLLNNENSLKYAAKDWPPTEIDWSDHSTKNN
jgi:hypothetical protein